MTRKNLGFALLAGIAAIAMAAQAKTPIILKSVNVTLPGSTRQLPDGPGVAAVNNNCLACHSAGMILNQPTMPKPAWQAEIAKMRTVYKAPVNDRDVPAIADYLAAVKGPK